MRPVLAWTPAALFAVGAVFTVGVDLQRVLPLREPLADALPAEIAGRVGRDIQISEQEIAVAGVTDYLMRSYRLADTTSGDPGFSVYVGYYDSQMQGKTIHSPKNCLPGAGWEPVESRPLTVALPTGEMTVNRYLLEKGSSRAIVYYWYQGRGRVSWNEFAVKWELLRDKALHGRSEEALVRIVVPLRPDAVASADSVASAAAREIVPALFGILAPLSPSRES
jgi:EpsI family protein